MKPWLPNFLAVRLALGRLPVVPTIAVALLMVGLVLSVHVVPAMVTARSEVHASLAEAIALDRATTPLARVRPQTEPQRLQAFLDTLGPASRSEEQVRSLFLAAEDAGLTLLQADYREVPAAIDGVRVLEIGLPVKGRYEQVRTFVAQLLLKVPFCALDSLRITRANAGEAIVEAKLRLSIYLTDATKRRQSEDTDGLAAPHGGKQ